MSEESNEPQNETQDDSLSVREAAEVIHETMMAEPETPEPEPAPEPEPEAQPSQLDAAQARLVSYQQELTNEAEAINAAEVAAKELRTSDPAEYAARMADIFPRRDALATAAVKFDQAVKGFDKSYTDKAVSAQQQAIANEQKKLLQLIPGWDKDKQAKLSAYLRGQGYTGLELEEITSARDVKLAWDAMTGRKRKTLPKKRHTKAAIAKAIIKQKQLAPHSTVAAAERIMRLPT